jgi:hypothetical protein
MRLARVLVLLLAAVPVGPALARSPAITATFWPSGLFGNVSMSKGTGDLGGMEIRFFERDGRHMAEFVYCEGWCNASHEVEVSREGADFSISYDERYESAGKPVIMPAQVLFRLQGKRLIVQKMTMDGKAVQMEWPERILRSKRKPFGLRVANDPD